jgi:large subunit ribosomal protein L17
MLANMATSLILHKRITTTTAKAKALRTYVEPLITKSKDDSTHSRRVVFGYLQNKEAVAELFREVSPKIAERPGGYTRILKTGNRLGDNADMCILELVDFNALMLGGEAAKKTTTRRRRAPKKKTEGEETAPERKTKAAAPKAKKAAKPAEGKEVKPEANEETEKAE